MFPFIDGAGEDGFTCKDYLTGAVIDELEGGEGEPARSLDDCMFGF
jgi:hypothetical protein